MCNRFQVGIKKIFCDCPKRLIDYGLTHGEQSAYGAVFLLFVILSYFGIETAPVKAIHLSLLVFATVGWFCMLPFLMEVREVTFSRGVLACLVEPNAPIE
jgi:hypothetical protein